MSAKGRTASVGEFWIVLPKGTRVLGTPSGQAGHRDKVRKGESSRPHLLQPQPLTRLDLGSPRVKPTRLQMLSLGSVAHFLHSKSY